jgi:hypothetical protein
MRCPPYSASRRRMSMCEATKLISLRSARKGCKRFITSTGFILCRNASVIKCNSLLCVINTVCSILPYWTRFARRNQQSHKCKPADSCRSLWFRHFSLSNVISFTIASTMPDDNSSFRVSSVDIRYGDA